MTSERDNSEETSQCLSLLQKRLSAKKVNRNVVFFQTYPSVSACMHWVCSYKLLFIILPVNSTYLYAITLEIISALYTYTVCRSHAFKLT